MWLILDLPVRRLLHGDASDLSPDQVPELWKRTALNDLLAVVRAHYSESFKEAVEDIKKDIVARLS